jgi:SAM-dependent methyltransferase
MKPEWIARQSRHPRGWAGEIVSRVMACETARANRYALERLALAPGEAMLEVGCGHGRTLAAIARRSRAGFLAGVDPSEVMVRLARRRLRRAVAEIRLGVSACLPYEDRRFDAALAVHVLYFWRDPAIELREIHRVLRLGGRLVLGFRPDDAEARAQLPTSIYSLRSGLEVKKLLADAGFDRIEGEAMRFGGTPFLCVRAWRPEKDSRELPLGAYALRPRRGMSQRPRRESGSASSPSGAPTSSASSARG